MRYAVIENNIVINVILASPEFIASLKDEYDYVDTVSESENPNEVAMIGDEHRDGLFYTKENN